MQRETNVRQRVLIWARVSTSLQETENQVRLLRDWVERRGWAVARVLEVTESAYRGKHLAALSTVYQGAARREFDIVVVFALDRLSRQGVGATFDVLDRLGRLGVAVASYSEPWLETGDPAMRELLLALAGWIAKQESVRRSERTRAGMARARAAGAHVGRPQGAKDAKPRRKGGYVAHHERLRELGRGNPA